MRLFFTLNLVFAFSCLGAQFQKCATMERLHENLKNHPERMAQLAKTAQKAANWREGQAQKTAGGFQVIPVIVHVVYTSAPESLTVAQIQSQIDVLNQDFARLNSDTLRTRPIFQGIAASMDIQFCLASTDPLGNPTTGIEYVWGDPGFLGAFNPFSDNVKSIASGGADPWPDTNYLNLWVCKLFANIYGYAQFPGEDPTTDGVVIDYRSFGLGGTTQSPTNRGRTATHEIGHWLGLYHIWGDGGCGVIDSIADTPDAAAANYGCDTTLNSCVDAGFDYPDMIENYMDYSDDSCMNMFTNDQVLRAQSFLNTERSGLALSNGCLLAGNKISESKFLRIFPNPAVSEIVIEFLPSTLDFSVSILNMQGKKVLNSNRTYIDVSGLPNGIYWVQVESMGKTRGSKLVLSK